jgi:hypothetical protein
MHKCCTAAVSSNFYQLNVYVQTMRSLQSHCRIDQMPAAFQSEQLHNGAWWTEFNQSTTVLEQATRHKDTTSTSAWRRTSKTSNQPETKTSYLSAKHCSVSSSP